MTSIDDTFEGASDTVRAGRVKSMLMNTRIALMIFMCVGLVLFGGSLIVSHNITPGDNYQIYRYISEYKNRTGVYPSLNDGISHRIDPAYHDYTPINSFIYRAIFSVGEDWQQGAYLFYEVSMIVIGLVFMRLLSRHGVVPDDLPVSTVLFFVLNPLVYRMLAADDKAGFFMWPLLCMYAAGRNAYAGAIAVGVFGGWTGLGVASVPALPGLSKGKISNAIILLLIATCIVVAFMSAEGIEGLDTLANRSHRELATPFSNSIWRWMPVAMWPWARYPAIFFFIGLFALLAWRNRLVFPVAVAATSSTYLLFSNNTVPSRLLFFVPVLAICFKHSSSRHAYLLFSFFSLLICHGLRRVTPGFNPDATVGVALCNAVLIIPLSAALVQSRARPRVIQMETV